MQFEAPESSEAAVGLLAEARGEARVLAGGTDLLVQMRTGRVAPELVVCVNRVPDLLGVSRENGEFRVGAATPSARISESAELTAAWPGVVEAMALVGSDQIQERASLAGNLCNASPAADSVPAMVAAGARVRIRGPKGERVAAVEEIVTAPGQTSLAAGEIVEAILLPDPGPRSGDAYLRFIPRTEMDIAVAGAAVSLALGEDGACVRASVALGAVAPTAIRVGDAESALTGSQIDDAALERVAEACSAACRPIDDKRGTAAFRTRVSGVLAKRAAAIALKRAKGERT